VSSARERLWERVYYTSREAYGGIPGYEDWDARLTADAAARGCYTGSSWSGYRKRNRKGLARMPAPGGMANLTSGKQPGYVGGIDWVLSDGTVRGCEFEPSEAVQLYWSTRLQAALCLPYLRLGSCSSRVPLTEEKVLRTWTQGRRGGLLKCPANFGRPPLPFAWPAIQITYISDKFSNDGKLTTYIHHFGPEVIAYFSQDPTGLSRPPSAIMLRGGRLSLKSHGLDG